jgi:hypothetical protein
VVILLVVLAVTNVVTVGLFAWFLLRPIEHPRPDEPVARGIERQRPAASTSSVRRVITIEILNPIEVAGSRGWWAGIAGSLAPGLTNRVVYDQAIKLVRGQLSDHAVVADVRLHVYDPAAVRTEGGPTTITQ